MSNIEFRWLKEESNRVLQWREGRYATAIKSGGYPPEERGTYETIWLGTNWITVPEVERSHISGDRR